MLYKRLLPLLGLVSGLISNLSAQALFHKPVKVLGDPQFTGTAAAPTQFTNIGPNWVEGRELNLPLGIALDNSVSPPNVYIADAGNNRVLGFRYGTQLTAGSTADVVIGQIDRFANLNSTQNGRSTGLNLPSGLAVDAAGNLYIADTQNNRIVRFPKPLSQQGAPFPDMVIGQTSFSTKTANAGGVSATSLNLATSSLTRSGLAFDSAGNLWISDTGNNRILRYPAAALKTGQNGPAADTVLGQSDFVSHTSATVQNSKSALSGPQGLAFDLSGRLLVSDLASRVLVYPANPGTGAVAIRILGVDTNTQGSGGTTQIGVSLPLGLAVSASGVIVADTQNHRVLVFPSVDMWPPEATQFSPSAIEVLGQTSYTGNKANQANGDASSSTFNFPGDVAVSATELFVADTENNRVLVFPANPAGIAGAAGRVIGQLDFPYYSANLIEGKEFNLNSAAGGGASGSAILDQSSTPAHLYVADTLNNRILGFADFAHVQNGQKADIVIGQPDLLRSVMNYPTGSTSQPNGQGLHSPTSLAVDSAGNLYVADTGNSRILRFPAPFSSGKTTLESADLVLGQSSANTIVTDPTAQTMNAPISIALTADAVNTSVANSGYLIAADAVHNRVLFFQKPFSTGMSASKVLGQSNFTSTQSSSTAPGLNSPRGVAVDPQDRVIVADTTNHRVQIFNKASGLNNYENPPISLASGFSVPVSLSASASGFWVADAGASSILHFPNIDQLPLKNNASDIAQPAVNPDSVFADGFGNLLVADGINRILYFAPQLDVVSAADFDTRPLTAGSLAAVFPHTNSGQTMPNLIAPGTDTASVIPLPSLLSDTQVLVGGTPAPLFFVSPGQINMQLSGSLPTGGTVDLQVIRQSTGQIYGGSEVQLASASPAFFTTNQAGTGQIVAVNLTDNSLNNAANPVARGQYITLYGTGIGPVLNAPADGSAPTGAVPGPVNPQVLIGSASAFIPDSNVQYSGLSPLLVGIWQLNILIPSNAQTGGSVPIKIFMNSIPNINPNSGAGNSTIAIK